MKRLVLISLLAAAVGVMAFLGCERPEPIDPTEGQPQSANEDSLINQQSDTNTNQQPDNTVVEHWKAVMADGYYNYYDSTFHYDETYTYAYMDIYPNDSVIYTVDIDSTDGYGLFTAEYSSYSMNGDTITVEVTSSLEPEFQRRWLVVHPNDTTMIWQYLGWTIGFSGHGYLFYLIGEEQ